MERSAMPSPAPHTGAGDRPRPAVLVLVRETTADVTAIDEALHARGARPIIRRPEALTIRINGRRPVILDADGSPLTPDACLGWTSLAARDAGLWLLRALEMA